MKERKEKKSKKKKKKKKKPQHNGGSKLKGKCIKYYATIDFFLTSMEAVNHEKLLLLCQI